MFPLLYPPAILTRPPFRQITIPRRADADVLPPPDMVTGSLIVPFFLTAHRLKTVPAVVLLTEALGFLKGYFAFASTLTCTFILPFPPTAHLSVPTYLGARNESLPLLPPRMLQTGATLNLFNFVRVHLLTPQSRPPLLIVSFSYY